LYHVSLDELLGIEREEVIPELVQKKTEEEQPAEEENSAKRAELEWKEQGIVFAVALASCVFPLCSGSAFVEISETENGGIVKNIVGSVCAGQHV